MTHLIVNADDLGVHPETNRGIVEAYRTGIVSSATLLMTTAYGPQAVAAAKAVGLPIGIHLSLTQGRARAPLESIPDLVDEDGMLVGHAGRFLAPSARPHGLLVQIEREFVAQLAAAADLGVMPTHIDSHQHVHMHPQIFARAEDAAARFGIRRMRRVCERFNRFELFLDWGPALTRKNHLKWALLSWLARGVTPRLECPRHFFGVKYSGVMTLRVLRALLLRGPKDGSLEISIHPGYSVPRDDCARENRGFGDFMTSPWRERELEALCHPDLPVLVRRAGFVLASFDGTAKEGNVA